MYWLTTYKKLNDSLKLFLWNENENMYFENILSMWETYRNDIGS